MDNDARKAHDGEANGCNHAMSESESQCGAVKDLRQHRGQSGCHSAIYEQKSLYTLCINARPNFHAFSLIHGRIPTWAVRYGKYCSARCSSFAGIADRGARIRSMDSP
jgi:hypothetical protein